MSSPIKPGKRSFDKFEYPSDIAKETIDKTTPDKTKEPTITQGPFEGLPLPLQKRGHTSALPYIRCNEDNQHETLAFLTANPSPIPDEKKVHLGFSV